MKNKENKMIYKKIASLVLAAVFLMCCAVGVSADESTAYNWYCIRTPGNKRPPCPAELSFIKRHRGYFIDEKKTDQDNDRVVYLTFDAGYENGNVAKILDTLKEKNVRGAFFILGNLVTSSTELVKRMGDEGHLVCNHTYRHRDMSKFTDKAEFAAELASLEDAYRKATGRELSKYYRPPEGRFSERNLEFAADLGYSTIFWSFAYADWDNNKQPAEDYAMQKIMSNVHNGAVILLHPTSSTNAAILARVIDTLRGEGYRFGTLDELCGAGGGELVE